MYPLVTAIVIASYNSSLSKYVLRPICFLFFLVIMKYEFTSLMSKKQSFIKIIYLMAQYGLFFCIQHLSGNLFQLLCKLLCLLDTKA